MYRELRRRACQPVRCRLGRADAQSGCVLEVFTREQPSEFGIRTTSGPTPFVYRYRFARDGADTVVHLDASVELPGAAAVLGRLAVRAVRRGVDANFADLKRTLEARAEDARSPADEASSRS